MPQSIQSRSVTRTEIDGDIATIIFSRPEKRNAMNDALVEELDAFFSSPPEGINVVILTGSGGHFCSGLDLAEHEHRTPEQGIYHSRNWHRVADLIEYGGLPVVSAMTGAVIGGGLEIAASTHVRIAEPSVRFQLPEGRRGIFVGGGATVRIGRLLGADRMREMMLTGRKIRRRGRSRTGVDSLCCGRRRSPAQGTRTGAADRRQRTFFELSDDPGNLAHQRYVESGWAVHREPCSGNVTNN